MKGRYSVPAVQVLFGLLKNLKNSTETPLRLYIGRSN